MKFRHPLLHPLALLLLFLFLCPEGSVSAPSTTKKKTTLNNLEDVEEAASSSSSSASSSLLPLSPPKFARPEHLIVRESAAHTFHLNCRATGRPQPNVTWYKDGVRIASPDERRFEPFEMRKWTLGVKNASPDDDGNYTCVVANVVGSIERHFDVKIVSRIMAHKPVVRAGQPGSHNVTVGSDLSLHCQPDVFDIASPPTVTWIRHLEINGSLRDADGMLFVETLQSCGFHGGCVLTDSNGTYNVEDATVLNLYNLTLEQSGWYSCRVENDQGRSGASGYVNVSLYVPEEDQNVAASEGRKLQKRTLLVASVTIVPLVIICFSCSVFCWFRYIKEKRQKLYAADAFNQVYQWTKVVLVEKQQEKLTSEPLLEPVVTIQKKRLLSSASVDGYPPETEYELLPDPDWEIDRSHLLFVRTLGEGAFGKVILAHAMKPLPKWKEMRRRPQQLQQQQEGDECVVAVKTLKEGHNEGDLVDLVKEMEIMKAVGWHPNIVNLLGVSTQPAGKPLLLVMEFVENGNLKDYLSSHRPQMSPSSLSPPPHTPLSPATTRFFSEDDNAYERPRMRHDQASSSSFSSSSASSDSAVDLKLMLKIAYEVAKGMDFLASRKCVHRDLAARNVLLTRDLVAKIADFGLARDIKSSDYYRRTSGGRVPLKWMAPEAIFDQRSTTKSDVWSFGILLYEIVTLGESPYKNVPIDSFLEQLQSGRRMNQPVNCPDNVYDLMRQCWELCPEERPTWEDLVSKLRCLYKDAQPLVYLDVSLWSPPLSPRTLY